MAARELEQPLGRSEIRPGETSQEHFRRLFVTQPAQERRGMSPLFFELPLTRDQASFIRGCDDRSLNWGEYKEEFSKTKEKNLRDSLLGIVSIHAVFTRNKREVYTGYSIPPENEDALRAANLFGMTVFGGPQLEFGPFIKPLEAVDGQVLRAVWERDRELYERFKHRIIPSFHPTEVAKLARLDPKIAKESLLRLTGLLGRKYITAFRYETRSKWFIPAARREDIQAFLAQNPQ